MLQKAGLLMEVMRHEIEAFSRASEEVLGYEVKLEKLSIMERDVIQYYLSAIGAKFPTV
jgi:hypothetical protein